MVEELHLQESLISLPIHKTLVSAAPHSDENANYLFIDARQSMKQPRQKLKTNPHNLSHGTDPRTRDREIGFQGCDSPQLNQIVSGKRLQKLSSLSPLGQFTL
jgi:hypothetical protein